MIWLRQSTAVTVSFGPAVLFSDGVTLVTNLVGTGANKTEDTSNGITLSKNGGAFAVRHATAGTSTYDALSGNYRVPLDATDTGTLGALRMNYVNASAFCPMFMDMMVVPAAVWDTYFASSGGVAFPTSGTLPNSTLTAAQIATGVWQDTTAGDFTTALSVGKSVMNGVSLGTGLTVAAVSGAVGSVTGAVGSVTGAVGSVVGLTASDVGAIKAKTDNLPAAPASTTNITAGTITTTTNLTNAPTSGDLTATMKTSVTTAATAATPIAASVTGAVGSVTGLTASNLDATVSSVKSKTDLIPGTQDGKTFAQTLLLMAATLLGKASGLGTATVVFRALDDSKDRVTTTVDASGNRTATTLDAS